MLDAFIIDRIREKQKRQREIHLPLQIQVPEPSPKPPERVEEQKEERGIVVVDFAV